MVVVVAVLPSLGEELFLVFVVAVGFLLRGGGSLDPSSVSYIALEGQVI